MDAIPRVPEKIRWSGDKAAGLHESWGWVCEAWHDYMVLSQLTPFICSQMHCVLGFLTLSLWNVLPNMPSFSVLQPFVAKVAKGRARVSLWWVARRCQKCSPSHWGKVFTLESSKSVYFLSSWQHVKFMIGFMIWRICPTFGLHLGNLLEEPLSGFRVSSPWQPSACKGEMQRSPRGEFWI